MLGCSSTETAVPSFNTIVGAIEVWGSHRRSQLRPGWSPTGRGFFLCLQARSRRAAKDTNCLPTNAGASLATGLLHSA